ncbi:uncharacterized protein LOC134466308 [Engraulis encrasicolus]|uniref:uncharacterized protein LOC134466308 n=1 Tax=Engraulis encrasicolus TaxID=184585 RepID=UPI002FD1B636
MMWFLITILGYSVRMSHGAFERRLVSLGDTVKIECNRSFYSDITWLKLTDGQLPNVLVTGFNFHNGNVTIISPDQQHLWGDVSVKNRIVALTVKNITADHLGLYLCATTKDKVLIFGTGVLLYVSGDENSRNVHEVDEPPKDCDKGLALPSTGSSLPLARRVYVAVYACAVLIMAGATAIVHILSRKKRRQ